MRDDAGAAELLRRIRARVAAEVKRLQIEVAPADVQAGPTGAAASSSSAWNGKGAVACDDSPAGGARARLTRITAIERALDGVAPGDLHGEWAGPGSLVLLEDTAAGERVEALLMPGHVTDMGPGYISLTSPVGEAIAGRGAGATVAVVLPDCVRTLRILALRTVRALAGVEARDLDASAGSGCGAHVLE